MLKLFNTLTGKKEEFKSIHPNKVGMYNCGPTVYNYAHIGNLRAYVFADVLRRTLAYNGYEVKQVMNITDVGHLTSDSDDGDDKMVKALKREGKPFTMEAMLGIGGFYKNAFMEDLKALNCLLPHYMPKASEHITEDIEIIQKLEEKGFAYRTSDGIYYDISKFPEYGKLGNVRIEGQLAGARVSVNSEKRNPADFSLWKFSSGEIGFPSDLLGKGFPGWHIECSGMSRKYLGQPFDIHTGGIDHIPVHHNNEIAQSEGAFGVPLANYWMHNEFLNINEGKMAKSGDNFLTLAYLNKLGISSCGYRCYLLGAHYRTPINFPLDKIAAGDGLGGAVALERMRGKISTLPLGGKVNSDYEGRFLDCINDDLNTAEGIAVLWELLSDEKVSTADQRATALKLDDILGLDLAGKNKHKFEKIEIPKDIVHLIDERNIARKNKDWKKSDELRQDIESKGYKVKDSEGGSTIEQV